MTNLTKSDQPEPTDAKTLAVAKKRLAREITLHGVETR
jgi:hypothetical protein